MDLTSAALMVASGATAARTVSVSVAFSAAMPYTVRCTSSAASRPASARRAPTSET